MLNRIRWRFIGAAMTAFVVVIVVLCAAVNWTVYRTIENQHVRTLEMLQQAEPLISANGEKESLERPESFERISRGIRNMERFFIVYCDEEGNVTDVQQDMMKTVSQEEASDYAQAVISKSASGYYKNYRYLIAPGEKGSLLLFLNVERDLQLFRTMLLVTGVISAIIILAVFLLVVILSGRAIAPYVRNIEMQKRFITDASHELKTPLTAISTSADILAMEREGDEWVSNIQSQCAKLSKLITNLVTLCRLDEEQPLPERAEFSLSEAVWEVTEPMEVVARAKGKNFSREIAEGIFVTGDRSAIGQTVSILLDNAIKYSDTGGTIRLCLTRRQKRPIITVYNTCPPFDPKQTQRLFDRFFRLDESRNRVTGGTGIGLSIAKATIEAHGGKISAASRDGRDITFTIQLP